MERALENIDMDVRDIYKVDLLVAMRWFKRAWMELPASSIENCWKHTGLPDSAQVPSEAADASLTAKLQRNTVGLVPMERRIAIAGLLNPPGSDDFHQPSTDDGLTDLIVGDHRDDLCSHGEGDDYVVPLLGTKEQLRVLAIAKRIVESTCDDNAAFLRTVHIAQRTVRRQESGALQQSTIDEFLKRSKRLVRNAWYDTMFCLQTPFVATRSVHLVVGNCR